MVREVTLYDFSSLKIVETYFMAHHMIYLLNVSCVPQEHIVEWSCLWISIRSIWLMVLVKSLNPYDFFFNCSISYWKVLLKSPTVIIDLPVPPSSFVSFCFMHVEAFLLCAYTFRIFVVYCYCVYLCISGNNPYFELLLWYSCSHSIFPLINICICTF